MESHVFHEQLQLASQFANDFFDRELIKTHSLRACLEATGDLERTLVRKLTNDKFDASVVIGVMFGTKSSNELTLVNVKKTNSSIFFERIRQQTHCRVEVSQKIVESSPAEKAEHRLEFGNIEPLKNVTVV